MNKEMKKMAKTEKKTPEKNLNLEKITLSPKEVDEIKRIGNSKPIIYIGMGSCGIAAGAQESLNKLNEVLEKYKIDAEIVKVGCLGCCYCEPILDVKIPKSTRVVYKKAVSNNIEEIIKDSIIEHTFKSEFVLGQHPSEKDRMIPETPMINNIDFFKSQKKFVLSRCGIVDPENLKEYLAYDNGYKALAKVLEKSNPRWVVDEIKRSGLRGRGGAGFPTGLKWEFGLNAKSPDGRKFIIMNADEGDPGAFMNRAELESDPFSAIEGMTIAGFAIGASEGYVYCRAEYPLAIKRIKHAILTAENYGLLGKNILGSEFDFTIKIKAGAGAFVCGEETALINSIEGLRGQPDIKPPYPTTEGVFSAPTVINNVETLHQIPKIINIGSKEFSSWGTDSSKGTKVFSLAGKITRSGLVEVPMGTTIKEIIDIGGGVLDEGIFKAAQCGGPSGGCVPKKHIDTPVDYESLKKVGAIMGSGGLVIMDEKTCMVETARFFMQFIQSESCGKCIPCREGTKRLLETLIKLTQLPKNDMEVVDRMYNIMDLIPLAEVIKETALCGLGKTAPNPVLSTIMHFKEEYYEHLYENKCRAKQCLGLVKFKIDTKKCIGCGVCRTKCPAQAIIGEKKSAHYVIDDKCIHCGLCYENCNFGAVMKL